jgi:hypothetical protein
MPRTPAGCTNAAGLDKPGPVRSPGRLPITGCQRKLPGSNPHGDAGGWRKRLGGYQVKFDIFHLAILSLRET